MFDFTLTPEQLSLQKRAREFALKEILPLAWFYDEANEIPMYLINKASELGLMNGDMPKKYGARNPFDFMDLQDVQEVTNFFERRVSAYQVGVQGEVAFDMAF